MPVADIIAALRENPYHADQSVEELRAATEARPQTLVDGSEIQPVDANGVPSEWLTCPQSRSSSTFLFIHGGGYYRGSPASSRTITSHIAHYAEATTLSVDYRLAPEYPFPAAIDDVIAAYRWTLDQDVDPKRLVVGGLSAGGGLTLSLLLALKESGDPMPAGAVALSAWADLTQSADTYQTNAANDPTISKAYLDRMAEYYLAGTDAHTPLASPLFGDLSGLPPMLLQVGDVETLLDDTKAFATKATAAGADVALEVWPGMFHGWHGNAGRLAEAREAIAAIGHFFKRVTG
ncbi:MAG: alpha/beta hydrolase [Pseudomonadota bacterium]